MGVFEGKVVLITGAGGNLGQVVTRRYAAAGAALALVERDLARVEGLAAEVGGRGFSADVTDRDSVQALLHAVTAAYGRVDVLAHLVGGYAAGQPVHAGDLDVWDKMMLLNARSVYVTAGQTAAQMVAAGVRGRIAVILARAAYKGTANHAAYCASKAAAQRIVESMAAELAASGITVNGIAPSTLDTPPNRASMPNADFSKWVQPDDIAAALLYLTSDEAGAVSGTTLDVYARA
jgi:NAD(P)-dependent dehydrogenase (short-subunit alcohol dehydrogenase family)